ncbi:MAG: hypothetical protein ABF768_08010 [Leuconostoc falkenbergense]|uniref:hypothetical protein n=1 Tax=Leuconostoc falkenbergense TaxID=2766470 RepID=UPI0039EC25C8
MKDALTMLGGDIQHDPDGYRVELYDIGGRGYHKERFSTEQAAFDAVNENADELREIAKYIVTQQYDQVFNDE